VCVFVCVFVYALCDGDRSLAYEVCHS